MENFTTVINGSYSNCEVLRFEDHSAAERFFECVELLDSNYEENETIVEIQSYGWQADILKKFVSMLAGSEARLSAPDVWAKFDVVSNNSLEGIEIIDELEALQAMDWEIPADVIEAMEAEDAEQPETIIGAFERHNGVHLTRVQVDYFTENYKDYYNL